jgi:hypothetical protein
MLARLLCLCAATAAAQDVVHLQDGRALHGRLERLSSREIVLLETLPGGRGSARRSLLPDAIRFIDFAPQAGEAEALADPAKQERRLLELWQETSVHLGQPASNAGAIGLALVRECLRQDDPLLAERALRIGDLIAREDWDTRRRAEARRGCLRALLKLRRLDEAVAEAERLARSEDDPDLLLEAGLVLAQAEFERLRDFETTHPRWRDDETHAAERTRLYHRSLDLFLRLPLFHGSAEERAAEALWGAVQVHRFAGETEAAHHRTEDLLALYPRTAAAARAKQTPPSMPPQTSDTRTQPPVTPPP